MPAAVLLIHGQMKATALNKQLLVSAISVRQALNGVYVVHMIPV
jgi:hypothetical protein